jgi:GNAT superfamily N-acetyltransferase
MSDASVRATSAHDLAPQARNLRAHWLAWGGPSGVHDNLVLYRSGLQHRLLNGVLRLRGQDVQAAAAEAERQLAGVPWRWWVGPDSDTHVSDALLKRGYERTGAMPIMSTRLDRPLAPDLPAGLTIESPTGPEGTAKYVAAYASSFGMTSLQDGMVTAERNLRTDLGVLIRLVGYLDRRPVASSATLISNGVAGLYWVATDPSYRGRGIGTALTVAAMNIAQDHGAQVCTLQASAMGAPVYRRLGFTQVSEIGLFTPPA